MRFILFILFLCLIASLCSCSKGWEDIETMPTKKVFIVSKRFTNPPEWVGSTWKPYKIVEHEILNVDYQPYEGHKPDTIISTCSIDKIDSLFKIEIRAFEIR